MPFTKISYQGVDEAELIHGLYHNTYPQGMGVLHNNPSFSIEDARAAMKRCVRSDNTLRFDYLAGRPLKVDIDMTEKTVTIDLYDRDAGPGQCQRVVSTLLQKFRR